MDKRETQTPGSGADQIKKVARYVKRMAKFPFTIIGISILVTALFVTKYFMSDKIFESSTTILIQEQKLPEEYVKSTVNYSPEKYVQTLGKQIMSRSRLELIIRQMNLYQNLQRSETMDEIVGHMRQNIGVQVYGKESFRITFTVNDPKTAQAVCERLAKMFISENVNERSKQAQTNADFLAEQAEESRARLATREEDIRKFKESNLGSLPSEKDSNSQTMDQLLTRLNTISEDLRSARLRRSMLEPQLTETVVGSDPNATLRRELSGRRRELAAQLLQFEESHPTVVALRSTIGGLEARLRDAPQSAGTARRINPRVKAQVKGIDDEIKALQGEAGQIKVQMKEIEVRQSKSPKIEMDLQSMEREAEVLRRSYTELLSKTEEAERARTLEEQNQGAQFKVLDAANLPTRPAGSGLIKLGAMGIILGLLLGMGLALLRVILDPKIYEPADLEAYIDAELLVSIPRFDRKKLPKGRPSGLPSPGRS